MNSADELTLHFCPYGYLDFKAVCAVGDRVWLFEADIFEIIDDFRESCWLDWYFDIDPVYCVLDHILQIARNKIDEELNYDFINDYSGVGSEIYTHWNYMCSSYDYSQWAIDELTEVLQLAPQEARENLLRDRYCAYFLREIWIDLSGGS